MVVLYLNNCCFIVFVGLVGQELNHIRDATDDVVLLEQRQNRGYVISVSH